MRQIKVGLALGAGAAKGWAHIGVINALKKLDVEIDIIAGCSVGALVGAAQATQHMPELERWVRSFSYWDVIKLMDFSWRRGGLLRGERVFNAVGELLSIDDISQCTIPFGAVATNLSTGRELWLTEGNVHQAIRASCSMPGLFSPVLLDGYWLVDGAVVNPVPVSLTRAMGADVVIAVDLQHDAHLMQQDQLSISMPTEETPSDIPQNWRSRLRERIAYLAPKRSDTPPSAMEIMSTSIQVLENRLKRNRMAGDPPDVLIQPYCPQISTLDFHRADEAIAAGELAVERKLEQLVLLAKKRGKTQNGNKN
ncbi:patatin-like phospholipase RssA [Yersinia nurmii]|uniref:NTE family protein rssA n=1 Tax=Yersinia nurmii TaxID=685706 RepID=A0AAW7K2L4_9GAMM|nr:patatin-like phospholipase RssA [Yersinia nurmii]MDN0086592.1 patatin-like phospholipase RssA [Yersinia nurmii]CNE56697.1 NTE family protein rssA [Yersinia nurmii]